MRSDASRGLRTQPDLAMTNIGAARFFDAVAPRYDRAYALSASHTRARARRLLTELPSEGASLLDLGVGTGREISMLLDAGYGVTGVDFSAAMLDRCARRFRRIPLVLADFWSPPLPFGDGTFDAAVALHGTLAHPPDAMAITRLARELARIVRTKGRFVAEVPSLAWLDNVERSPLPSDRRVIRTGPRTCLLEDTVVGVAIEARIVDPQEWALAFSAHWSCRVESISQVEWLVVADRT
jgi:SAM-dependent methyltransferase